jgi:hypothetical protein
MEKLVKIQSELKAPKNQFNSFGKYNYRSCEDILEAVKPLLLKYNCSLVITDEVKEVSSVIYVEATALIRDNETNTQIGVTAQAGIEPNKKGMDISQSFGSSSSYARKYALNGLFLIDDTKDSDATNKHGKDEVKEQKPKMHQLTADNVKSIIAKGTQQEVLDQIGKKYMATTIQIKELMDSIKK